MAEFFKCTVNKSTLFDNWLADKASDAEKESWYHKLIYFPLDSGISTFWFFSDKLDENTSNAEKFGLIAERTDLESIPVLADGGLVSITKRQGLPGFVAQLAAAPLILKNLDFSENNAASQPRKPLETQRRERRKETSGSKKSVQPSTRNISFGDAKNKIVLYRIGDLRLFNSTATLVLKDAQKRLNYFGITLDKPINLNYHADSIREFPPTISRILEGASIQYNDNDFIKIKFNKENYKFESLAFVKSLTNGSPAKDGQEITDSSFYTFFRDSTTNSVIYNLSRIYNRYNKLISREANFITSQTSIFYSSDTVRVFLNKYIYPRTSIATSEITRDLVEKFIIGDVRILDDDLRKNFFINSSQIPDSLRGNLQREVSKQYEKIGDALGDAWISGQFERVDDVDDLFEQLLNYISIPDLISLSAKCLLKLIPLDELLDLICKPVLKEFDKHKEGIIQALDEMDDGIAKDLARELKEIYFNRLLNEQLEQNVAQGIIAQGISKAPSLVQDSETQFSWQTKTGVSLFYDNLSRNFELVKDSVDEFKNAPQQIGNFKNVKTVPYSGLKQRMETVLERISELEKEQRKLEQQVSVFNGNIPQNLVELQLYYAQELSRQRLKRDEIEQGIENGNRQIEIYNLLLKNVFPNLITLDPFLDNIEKNKLFTEKNYTGFSYTGDTNQKQQDAAKQLNLVSLEGFNEPIFNFSTVAPLYSAKSLRQKKNEFNFNIQNGLTKIIDELQRLQAEQNAPFNILNSLEKFGVGVLDGFFFDPKEGLFSDPTKRYYLCLAIYSAVPAVFYAIHLVVENTEDVVDFLEDQGKTIYEAIKKKLEIFARTDYPIFDIIGEFVDALIQVGINFGRDLLVNGIMWVIKQIAKACGDQEKINAPYSPIGAIDLSGYMASSTIKGSTDFAGDSKNTQAFLEVIQKDPQMTPGLFDTILSRLSQAFSINEIASLLDASASDSLYTKAIHTLESLTPLPISKESAFYQYYVNEAGIREFFQIISESIDPALIVNFQNEYGKQKQMLLDICFGYDDSVLEDLFDGLDEAAVREALAANYASKIQTVPLVEEALDKLLGENVVPDPCEAGVKYFTDAEKFTLKTAMSSIYEALNSATETAVSLSKKSFKNTRRGLTNYTSLSPEYGESPVDPFAMATDPENKQKFDDLTKQNKIVGLENFKQLKELSKELKLSFTTDENNRQVVSFNYENIPVKQSIEFSFDSSVNKIEFAYSNLKGVKNKDELEPYVDIASYQENNYFLKQELDKQAMEGPGIFESDLNLITSPEHVLFNPFDGVVLQPKYSQSLKRDISDVLRNNDLMSESVYYLLLNSIFEDLLFYPFKTGLYLQENFDKLNLNKLITADLQQIQGGQLTDKCFLGFMDDTVLTTQTLNLAERISCYAKNSPTIAPSNVASLKVLFDAFVRTVALQEMMKSFFVIGIFPKDLVFDTIAPGSNSIYEQIIKINTIKSVEGFVTSGGQSYEKFYDEVFRQFVTDITRILFKNNEITDVQAFDFVVNSQIQFIKDQFKKAYENAFGVNSTTIFGTTEYQLLKEQTSLGDLDDTVNEALLDINDEQFTYSEKLRAIQNDGMADFYQGVVDSGRLSDSKSFLDSNGNQKITIQQDSNSLLPYGIPLYKLENTEDKEYFDIEDLRFKETTFLEDLTLGNNKGFVLEEYIELKPNSSLMSNIFDPQVKETIEDLLLKTSAILNIGSEGTENKDAVSYRKQLKMLFYESKLFMMFPQAIDFIHSLDEIDNPNSLWKYYYSLREPHKPNIGPYSPEPEYQVDKVVFDLFYWIFKLNYDKPEEFFSNEKSLEWYQFIKTADNGQLFEKINLSLSGKIKLNDFKYLLDKCLYPSYADEVDGNNVGSPWGNVVNKGAFLSELNILNEPMSARSTELLTGEKTGSYLNGLFNKNSNTRIAQFFEFLSFENIYGQENEGNAGGYAGADALVVDELFNFLNDKIKQPQEYFQNLNFFEWLYTRKTYQIVDVSTVLRVNTKLPDFDISSGEAKFVLSGKLSNTIFNDQMSEATKDQIQLEMLKEKIGLEEYASKDIASNYLFSTPMYEIKQRIPNLSWLEFFVAVNKFSYYFEGEDFYKLEGNPNTNLNLNDILFSNDRKDLFSYFHKLKAFSDSRQKETTTIKKSQFYSTFWWNIKGKGYDLAQILEKVYSAGTIDGVSIYDILTEESLKSFYEENYLAKENFAEVDDIHFSSPQTAYKDIKVAGRKLFIESTNNGGDIPPEEYNAIVKQALKLAAVNNIQSEDQNEPQDPTVKKQFNLVKSGLDPQGNFNSGVTPFVEINDNLDWGWPYYDGGGEIFDSLVLEADDFDAILGAGASIGIDPTDPFASLKESLGLPEKPYYGEKMKEIVGTLIAAGFNYNFNTNKNVPIGCTQDPKTHEDSIRELGFIEEGKGVWVNGKKMEILEITKTLVEDPADPSSWNFIEKTITKVVDTFFYTGWIFPKNGYDDVDFGDPDSYYLAVNTTKNGLTFWAGGPSAEQNYWLPGTSRALGYGPGILSDDQYDADGQPLKVNYMKLASNQDPDLTNWDKAVKQRFMEVRFGFVKGGLGAETQEILTKEIEGQFPNVYDLFAVMLKSDSEKQAFADFINCFFIKEQATIIALLHRILTEEHYPQIDSMFRRPIFNSLSYIRSTLGSLTGDYQTNTSPSSFEQIDNFIDAAGELGVDLLKSFLKATASTVDPTWRTPWFLPGPLTPFGVAAKLLDEDFSTKKSKQGTPQKQSSIVCADSLKSSTNFFEEYSKVYQEVLGGKNPNNTGGEGDVN